VYYTQDQLCSIFNGQGTARNGWYALAHQLIAAELNIANGACAPTEVTDAIVQANALMSQTTCYPNNPSLPSSATSDLTNTLDHFNQGDIGPGQCQHKLTLDLHRFGDAVLCEFKLERAHRNDGSIT
jgi:hypothetical protein